MFARTSKTGIRVLQQQQQQPAAIFTGIHGTEGIFNGNNNNNNNNGTKNVINNGQQFRENSTEARTTTNVFNPRSLFSIDNQGLISYPMQKKLTLADPLDQGSNVEASPELFASNAVVGLAADVFAVPVRRDVLHRVIVYQRNKKRQGTRKTKTISEISGTTRKPHAQKGTGRARQGSRRSPHMRGGSTMFGPVVRSHAISLPKKVRAMGLKCALSAKLATGDLIILDGNSELATFKTSALLKELEQRDWTNVRSKDRVLMIEGVDRRNAIDTNLALASSNVHFLDVLPFTGLNVYDIVNSSKLVLTKEAVEAVQKRLLK
eukprot:TRINITY_DN537_c0_g2_i26.p3 TRINITY_DN537_c0_g2~~TRINITY_DN537_c0_g2_i26.p3  ORF type:complete len:320 (+),score=123.10 TRINITY_DN537_c0_g2_i26:2185-3144(+)